MSYPIDDGFYMPPEWAPHARCWMEWPTRADLWGEDFDAARDAYAEVAKAIARFEPVTMIANPDALAEVSLKCGGKVSALPLEHDDSWMRDNGPTFLVDGKGGLAGADWRFNGWGERYKPYDKDAAVAQAVLEHLAVPRYDASFVLEGGAIHVDGEGTLITTEQCLLNPNRNPGLDRKDLEELLRRYLGIETVIWLGEGLEEDETDGHVDNIACFVRPAAVMLLSTADESDGNFRALSDNRKRLQSARDAKGRALEIIEIEQPKRREGKDGRRLALSYVNFYFANGGVVVPAFEDARDEDAFALFEKCFPDREVVQVLTTDIVPGGGGIHCITQQQPQAGEAE